MARNDAALQKLNEETLALMANGQLDLFKYRTAKAALPLKDKQLIFANVYAETGDRTRAANVAYDCANDDVARVMAHRQLHNPKVLNYLEKLLEPQTLYNMVLNTWRPLTLAYSLNAISWVSESCPRFLVDTRA